jgi:signal transduction histidine kinase
LAGQRWELLLIVGAVVLTSRILFGNTLPLVFLVFPFVLWAAVRLGPLGAVVVNMVVAWTAVWATVMGNGAFAGLPTQGRLVSLQSFIASVSLTGLVLAAVTASWRWALDDVRVSRARLVEAGDVERRRVERNLHDGAQQRLVALSFRLGLAQGRLGPDADPALRRGIEQAAEELGHALSELRDLAHGIHPAILSENGLRAAVESLGERLPVPVQVSVTGARYSALVEATAYFVVSEGLANAVKHARASVVFVDVRERRGSLVAEVRDDGLGGATRDGGSGLVGLGDRVAAVGGCFEVESPPGAGTCIRARIPCR